MKKLCNYLAAACLLVCGCIFAFEAQARVCFATDENCGGAVDFPEHTPDVVKEQCALDGYTEASCEPYQLEYRCPYKASLKKCCDKDYNYSSCPYPLIRGTDVCGGKFKCTCASNYKYSSDPSYGTQCPQNSTPGGLSCIQQRLNSSRNGLDNQALYTECKCDRALFPYSPAECDKNAEVGDSCFAIDSNGKTTEYYSACYCDRKIYQYSASGCSPYIGDENKGKCSSGGTTYYRACKSCQGYPAQNLDHVGYNNGTPDKKDYEVCPYRQVGNEYKILACRDPGYRVSVDGDYDVDENGNRIMDKNGSYVRLKAGEKCIPMSCADAVKEYLPGSTYALFDGSTLKVKGDKAPAGTVSAVIADDISIYSPTCKIGGYTQKQVCSKFCCKYKVKAKDEQEWEDDKNGNELGTKIVKKDCVRACCLSDGSNADLVPGEGNICATGTPKLAYDNWTPSEPVTCPKGSSAICTKTEDNISYDRSEVDETTEYELDPDCVYHQWDVSYIGTPSKDECPMPSTDNSSETYRCAASYKASISNSTAGLGCVNATNYYSPQYLIKTLDARSDGARALNVACKKMPTVTYKGNNFPNGSVTNTAVSIYGVDLNFSNTVTFGTAKVNIIDTNVKIANNTTLTTKGEVVLTSQGKVNANPKVEGATLSIGNKFISTGYDYNLTNVNVTGGLSVPVAFMGGSAEKTFRVNNFNVNGIVGFAKYSVYSKNTSIALSIRKSGISLYNTNWYMFERPAASYKVRMISMGYLGAPTSCEAGAFNSSAKIIFSNDRVYKALAGRDKLYNGEDNYRPKDHVISVPYVSETGYKLYRYCTNKGTNLLAAGAGHHSSGSNYDMTWEGNSYDLSWNHKHGCGKCIY